MVPRRAIRAARSSSAMRPAPIPMTTIRPLVARLRRSSGRLGAPTSSRTTSNGPWPAKSSGAQDLRRRGPRTTSTAQRRVAHGGGDPRPRRHPDLHRGGAHAAGRPVHQEALAHRQPALGEHGVVGGGKDLWEAAGLVPGKLATFGYGGDGHGNTLVDHRRLGLAGATEDRHDPVAGREPGDVRPDRHHLAGHLQPGDVRRGAG